MAQFPGLSLTAQGNKMILRASTGKVADRLIVTKAIIGDGQLNTSIEGLTRLVSAKLEIGLSQVKELANGQMQLQFNFDNKKVDTGFYWREVGLYAKSGDSGEEKLIGYSNAKGLTSYIPDKTNALPMQRLVIALGVGDNPNVKGFVDLTSAITLEQLEKAINQHNTDTNAHGGIMKKFLPLTGGTVTGNVTLENGSWLKFNNQTFTGAVRITERGTLDVGISDNENGSVENMNICSMNRPGWYNKNLGSARQLALVEEINAAETRFNASLNNYLPLTGGTLTGDLTFNSGNGIKIKGEGGNHTISRGGKNLNIGNESFTEATNLCCKKRPSWYAGPDNVNNGYLMKLSDINVSSGKVNHGDTLPIPAGFTEQECTWLLSIDHANISEIYMDINESGTSNMFDIQCWKEGRVAHVGILCKGFDGFSRKFKADYILYDHGGENSYFIPGTASYVCIAVKKA